ncbi:hypothetical protein [Streptomyces sp.]|uniref:hypothetical protein n=1 Tax=Streptomyces sp. TaxID=1931 RepID=UPI002F3F74AD
MRVAVVGLGAAGARLAATARADGHHVRTVAPGGTADASDVARLGGPPVDAWILATPTATHLGLVRRLLRLDPAARILLEQPACSPEDLPVLAATLDAHPAARVLVNDVYAHSPAVRRFAGILRATADSASGDRVVRITVEFTKNRERDIARGRFVDTQYGVVGYEWLDMLAILRAIVPPTEYARYLCAPPSLVTSEMRVLVSGHSRLPEIELYASAHGRVGFPRLAVDAFTHPIARRRIARGCIPYGSELRYRFADVEFASGARVTLVFEPHYQTAQDYKNVHAVHVRGAAGDRRTHLVPGNQLREALAAQLATLTGPDPTGTTGIRLPEHHHLASLAGHPHAHGVDRLAGAATG